jgi:23S rRNA (uracil1939-C5)-methyltransferase
MLLTIDKLIYGGDGLAHLPPDEHGRGKAVFVPFVLAGEQVEAEPVEEKPGFLRARLERVASASRLRSEPPCPYYQRCGGCHYQHTSYQHQLEIKQSVLRENLSRFAKLDWDGEITVHPSPPLHYRNRTRLQVRTKPEFMLAYYRHGSRELLPVDECPISSELINQAIAGIWEVGRGGHMPDPVREIEFFADDERKQLLIELYLDPSGSGTAGTSGFTFTPSGDIKRLELAFFALSQGKQFREPQLMRPKDADWAVPSLTYNAAGAQYRVSAGSFFQTNRFLTDEMVSLVTGGRSGEVALDLYAGVGLFAVPLAKSFVKVIAVEASTYSAADLKHNSPANVRAVRETTDRYMAKHTGSVDLIVVDPPRAGLGEKVTRALLRLAAPRITYVSCDPSTLARDLRALLAGGYRVEEMHLLDLFPQTFHIETLVQLVK